MQRTPKKQNPKSFLSPLKIYLLMMITGLMSASAPASALGIGPCNPEKSICLTLITDHTIGAQTQIHSQISYDIASSHTVLTEGYDWISPNSQYTVIALPMDLVSRAQIRNLSLQISELNHYPLQNCSLSTPRWKKITAAQLNLRISFNSQSNAIICTQE